MCEDSCNVNFLKLIKYREKFKNTGGERDSIY